MSLQHVWYAGLLTKSKVVACWVAAASNQKQPLKGGRICLVIAHRL